MIIKIETNARNAYLQSVNKYAWRAPSKANCKLSLKVTLLSGGQPYLWDIMFKHALRMITKNDCGLVLMVCHAASHNCKQIQRLGWWPLAWRIGKQFTVAPTNINTDSQWLSVQLGSCTEFTFYSRGQQMTSGLPGNLQLWHGTWADVMAYSTVGCSIMWIDTHLQAFFFLADNCTSQEFGGVFKTI